MIQNTYDIIKIIKKNFAVRTFVVPAHQLLGLIMVGYIIIEQGTLYRMPCKIITFLNSKQIICQEFLGQELLASTLLQS